MDFIELEHTSNTPLSPASLNLPAAFFEYFELEEAAHV